MYIIAIFFAAAAITALTARPPAFSVLVSPRITNAAGDIAVAAVGAAAAVAAAAGDDVRVVVLLPLLLLLLIMMMHFMERIRNVYRYNLFSYLSSTSGRALLFQGIISQDGETICGLATARIRL